MNGNNANNVNNASNTLDVRYSQLGGFLDSLSEAKAKEKGKKIAKALQDGLNQGLKDLPGIGVKLAATTKEFEANLEAIKKKSGQAFSPEAANLQKKYINEANKLLEKRALLESAISKEINKVVPDQKKIVELNKQLTDYEERANFLNNTAAQQKELILAKERERALVNEKIELLQQDQNKNTKKALELNEQRLKAEQANIQKIQNDISNIESNLKEMADDVNSSLDETGEKGEKALDKLNEGIKKVKNGVASFQSSLNDVMSAISIDKAINDWDTQLDQYTKRSIQMGNRWGTGYSKSNDFNDMKNAFVDALAEDEVGYSLDQIYEAMDDVASYSFDNKETAIKMASDLAFAKEYMGQTSASLHSMYALQVRTGQDDFLKKSLNTIAALQRTGNALAQDQMDQLSQSSMTLTEKLMDMGMSGNMADEAYSGMMAFATAMEQTTGRKGDSQRVLDMFDQSLNLDTLGQMVSSPQAYLNALNSGNYSDAFNMLLNGPSAKAANANRSDGLSFGGIVMGNEDVFGGFNNNDLRRFTDASTQEKFQENLQDNLNSIAKGSDALDEMKDEVSENIPQAVKDMQKNAQALAETDWGVIAEQLAYEKEITTILNRITGKIDALIAVVAASQFLGKAFSGGKSLLGKAGGASGLISKIGSIGGGSGSLGAAAVNGLGITAGVVATGASLYDGFSVGLGGYKDENGNKIKGTGGFGDGLTAAVSNQDLYASTGKDVGSGALKGAGVGAMIGTFIGGPVGTAVGGAIGAGVGAIAGIFAHNSKERKKAEIKAEKQRQDLVEMAKITAQNTEAIKNARDVVLSNRYDDNRWSYSTASSGGLNTGAMGDVGAMGSTSRDVRNTGLLQSPWGCSRGYEMSTKYVDGKPTNEKTMHHGIDLTAPANTPIGSASDGEVTFSGWLNNGGGNQTHILDKATGYEYWYLHQVKEPPVAVGQQVRKGDTIGYVGSTGNSSGNHLHFSVRKNGAYVEPLSHLSPYIFNASGVPDTSSTSNVSDWVSSSSAFKLSSNSSRDAESYSTSMIPNFQTAKGSENTSSSSSDNGNILIIEGLKRINDTLIAIDKRQSDQQRILDALTKSPIQNLGV